MGVGLGLGSEVRVRVRVRVRVKVRVRVRVTSRKFPDPSSANMLYIDKVHLYSIHICIIHRRTF